jgi:hypothetical protein
MLYEIDKMGGRVISVTTDGFVTDIDNLESKLSNIDGSLMRLFREARLFLTEEGKDKDKDKKVDDSVLELKHSGRGIIS